MEQGNTNWSREREKNKWEWWESRLRRKQGNQEEEVFQRGKGTTTVASCEEPGQDLCWDKMFVFTLKALGNIPKSMDFFILLLFSNRKTCIRPAGVSVALAASIGGRTCKRELCLAFVLMPADIWDKITFCGGILIFLSNLRLSSETQNRHMTVQLKVAPERACKNRKLILHVNNPNNKNLSLLTSLLCSFNIFSDGFVCSGICVFFNQKNL